MKRVLLFLLLLTISSIQAQEKIFEDEIVIATKEATAVAKEIPLVPYEVHLKSLLKEIVTFFSKSKNIQIRLVNSPLALEFQVFYGVEDHQNLQFMSGLRLRAIRTLFNELSISAQQANAELAAKKFDYYQRKVHIISFHNRGLQ